MEKGNIKIKLDVFGNPFVVDACKTDGTKHRLSTYYYIKEEISNCSYEDLFSHINKAGIYIVIPEYDDYPEFILKELLDD